MLRQPDQTGLVARGQKVFRQQDAATRVADTGKRFRPGQTFAAQIDFRLVPDFQPVLAQRPFEFDLGLAADAGEGIALLFRLRTAWLLADAGMASRHAVSPALMRPFLLLPRLN